MGDSDLESVQSGMPTTYECKLDRLGCMGQTIIFVTKVAYFRIPNFIRVRYFFHNSIKINDNPPTYFRKSIGDTLHWRYDLWLNTGGCQSCVVLSLCLNLAYHFEPYHS